MDRLMPNLLKSLDALKDELRDVRLGMGEIGGHLDGLRADLRVMLIGAGLLLFLFILSRWRKA
jgi:hypothetical protein